MLNTYQIKAVIGQSTTKRYTTMGIRHDLQRTIYQVLKHNRDGSYATQNDRKHILFKFADDLIREGMRCVILKA